MCQINIMEVALGSVQSQKSFSYKVYFFMELIWKRRTARNLTYILKVWRKFVIMCKMKSRTPTINRFPLVLVTLEIINLDAVVNSDDFSNFAICDITLYDINESMDDLKYGLLEL